VVDEPEEIVIRSDDPIAMAVRQAMKDAAIKVLDDAKVEGPQRVMALTMALVGLVWDSASINRQIMTTTVSTLMNLAVDAGLGEAIGMKLMSEPPERVQ
jgi:hypothetical protein